MSTRFAPISKAVSMKPDFSIFDQHQSKLRELYLERDKSLADVKKEMETHHGFPTTDAKVYEYGLRHLGFVKKLSVEEWAQVNARVQKRKEREGKETDVLLSGIPQPLNKIRRIISRHKRGEQVQERIFRGPTPDLPESIFLSTPSPPPSNMMDIVYSAPNTIPVPSSLSEVSNLNFLDGILMKMILDSNSTVHMLFGASSSQLWERLKHNVILGSLPFSGHKSHEIGAIPSLSDLATAHNMTPISLIHQKSSFVSYPTNPIISLHGDDVQALGWFHTVLMNNGKLKAADFERILAQVGTDGIKSFLRAFFSHCFSDQYIIWAKLIRLSKDMNSGDAFKILIEVGFEIHGGAWIPRNADTIIESAIELGSTKIGKLLDKLLLRIVTNRGKFILGRHLWLIIEQLDIELMSKFIGSGAQFTNVVWSFPYYNILISRIVRLYRKPKNQRQWTNLLKLGGFSIDTFISPRWIVPNVFTGFDDAYDFMSMNLTTTNIQWSILDHLCLLGALDIYNQMVVHSKRAKTYITISGLLFAARSGIEQLELYLHTRLISCPQGDRQKLFLETTLSVAARLGDVAAIATFSKAGVDPNACLLLLEVGNYKRDWHPLMQAAAGKHLNAVRMLVEMGAESNLDLNEYTPLSAAVWTPAPLSDKKQTKKLDIARYFLTKDLARRDVVDAMVKAVRPPIYNRQCHWGGCGWKTLGRFVPDEKVIDMLLEAGIGLDEIKVDGKDILHDAIHRGCNLRTVEILLSRGAQVHSRPCEDRKTTMLDSAAASKSTDYLQIVKILLQSGVKWDSVRILELALPATFKPECLPLFSFLLEHGLLECWPEVASKWPPILTRLLNHHASDELIRQAIEAGADIHMRGPHPETMYTPLQLAALQGRLDIAHELLSRGADINARAFVHKHTVLQAACYRFGDNGVSLGFIKYLLENGANINAPGGFGSSLEHPGTAIQCAVKRGSIDLFCFLLDAGANFHAAVQQRRFSAPLHNVLDMAARWGRIDMVDILIRKGAQSARQYKGPYSGAIELAYERKHYAIVEVLEKFAKQAPPTSVTGQD